MSQSYDLPALIHVTHWKSGSQWLHKILRACFPERIVAPTLENKQFLDTKILSGRVYPTVYVTREEFERAALPAHWYRFVVIRDLRDTLISGYFSIKNSHPPVGPIPQWRKELQGIPEEEGILWTLEHWLPGSAAIQASWLEAGVELVKYEDLLRDDVDILSRIIIREAGYPISASALEKNIFANRFVSLSGGRQPGEEDPNAHERKGIAGDWRNHFTPFLEESFMKRYGTLLENLGYE